MIMHICGWFPERNNPSFAIGRRDFFSEWTSKSPFDNGQKRKRCLWFYVPGSVLGAALPVFFRKAHCILNKQGNKGIHGQVFAFGECFDVCFAAFGDFDSYKEVTDRIIAQMGQGVIPWHKPWIACRSAVSRSTGKAYSLLNQMLLGKPGEYVTFKQCQQEGGKVKKGEKASMVVFWKWLDVKDDDTEEIKQIPMLRYFSVFHIDQCEGLTLKYTSILPNATSANENADNIINDYVQRSGGERR